MIVVQQIVNGLVVGSVYALFALGFTLIFGVQRVLNLAHGSVFMCGSFAGLLAVNYIGASFALALLVGALAGGAVSVIVDRLAFWPLRRRKAPEFAAIISSIGLSLILISIAQRASGTIVFRYPFDLFPIMVFRIFGIRLSLLQLVLMGVSWTFVLAIVLTISFTDFGRRVRAVAIDTRASSLLGINPEMIYFATFLIAGAVAGVAGVLIGIAFNSVQFLMGEPFMLRTFVVVILGGLGSVSGALIASLFLGIAYTLIVGFISSGFSDAILFSVLFLALLIRPTGLFGTAFGEKRVARS